MNEKLAILKRALRDPIIPESEMVSAAVANSSEYVSEWVDDGGAVMRVEYRRHRPELGSRLKALLDEGFRSGRPRLSDIYTPEELRELRKPQR